MRPICAECQSRPVHVISSKHFYGSARNAGTHDLCDRCYRSLRDKVVAARQKAKPAWAIRSTLVVLEEQAVARSQAERRRPSNDEE